MSQIPQDKYFEGLNLERLEMTYPCGTFVCFKTPAGDFFRIDHFADCYVIEYAENEDEARANCFDDGELFDDTLPEEELIRQIQKAIICVS